MAPPPVDLRPRILATLEHSPGLTKEAVRRLTKGGNGALTREVAAMVTEGLLATRPAVGGGQRYWLAGQEPPTARDVELARQGAHDGHRLVAPGTTAPGYALRGVSTLYGGDGTVKSQWVKTELDREAQLEAMRAAVAELAEPWRGAADPVPPPTEAPSSDLLTLYPLGDPHIGMYAWGREAGQDHDTATAEADLLAAVDYLAGQAPPSRQAVVASLGDFFHSDNADNRTARSGHALDVDGRFAKVVASGLRVLRRITDRALERHAEVRVIPVVGNHDDHTSVMLGLALDALYEREPRVTVDTSPSAFRYVLHGATLLGFAHGHTCRPNKLPGVMATDMAREWGETRHRYWHTGHIHTRTREEFPGVSWESHRTLAPRDAWASASGYRSGQDMLAITYHAELGEVHRHTAGIELVRALRDRADQP